LYASYIRDEFFNSVTRRRADKRTKCTEILTAITLVRHFKVNSQRVISVWNSLPAVMLTSLS